MRTWRKVGSVWPSVSWFLEKLDTSYHSWSLTWLGIERTHYWRCVIIGPVIPVLLLAVRKVSVIYYISLLIYSMLPSSLVKHSRHLYRLLHINWPSPCSLSFLTPEASETSVQDLKMQISHRKQQKDSRFSIKPAPVLLWIILRQRILCHRLASAYMIESRILDVTRL